jgi:hypothetical protein
MKETRLNNNHELHSGTRIEEIHISKLQAWELMFSRKLEIKKLCLASNF